MTVTISRLSRPLAISMVICLWMINLNLVIRVRPVDILVAITTMAISSLSRSLLIIMINLITIRSMIMITVLVNIRVSMSMVITISWFSRPLAISMVICLGMINFNLVIRVWSVDVLVAITTMAISSLSRSLLIIMINLISI